METRFAVVIGLDVGKTGHHACALDPGGSRLFDKPLPQDEAGPTQAEDPQNSDHCQHPDDEETA